MAIVIVKKTFKYFDIRSGTTNALMRREKIVLKAFNQLSYNWEVSRLLVAYFSLVFEDYYFLIAVLKTINLVLLKTKFEYIFCSQNFNQSDNIMHIDGGKVRAYMIYEYYIHRDLAL